MNRRFACGALLVACGVAGACGPDQGPPYGGANALQGVSVPIAAAATASCGTPVSNNACAVKFAKDLMPLLEANCKSCHGQGNQFPNIEDAAKTYKNFEEYRLGLKLSDPTAARYINPCSTDPTASFILCNVQKDGKKATCGTHMPTSSQISEDAVSKIKTWVECGAPNN